MHGGHGGIPISSDIGFLHEAGAGVPRNCSADSNFHADHWAEKGLGNLGRHSGARVSANPGISRFRVWSFGTIPGMTGTCGRNMIGGAYESAGAQSGEAGADSSAGIARPTCAH